jgi:preprotein translocase subunit SecY
MFAEFGRRLKMIAQDRSLRNRILFVIGALVVFRMLAAVPVPGIDAVRLEEFFSSNEFLGLLNIFSGGGLANLSIVMLGVAPYITASIIMQLMTVMSPRLKAMYQEEGEAGKRKFTQYSRLLTLPLALVQGFGFLTLLERQGVIASLTPFELAANVLVVAAGSLLLMWIGELISEFGIGNGVSLIIFAGIVAGMPAQISELLFTFSVSQLPLYVAFLVAAVVIVGGVTVMTEAERPIPITYARRVRGMKQYGGVSTYLPLRLNQAGVIPIIFALSVLLFPQMVFNFLSGIGGESINAISTAVLGVLQNSWVYGTIYFVLVFLFTYFYTAVTFDPNQIANNLQKSGAFIPGIRPGRKTAEYIGNILTRLTLVGATFLGAIAVLPLVMQGVTGVGAFAIGGTALLIAVTVVLDLVRRIDAQLSIREY